MAHINPHATRVIRDVGVSSFTVWLPVALKRQMRCTSLPNRKSWATAVAEAIADLCDRYQDYDGWDDVDNDVDAADDVESVSGSHGLPMSTDEETIDDAHLAHVMELTLRRIENPAVVAAIGAAVLKKLASLVNTTNDKPSRIGKKAKHQKRRCKAGRSSAG